MNTNIGDRKDVWIFRVRKSDMEGRKRINNGAEKMGK